MKTTLNSIIEQQTTAAKKKPVNSQNKQLSKTSAISQHLTDIGSFSI